MDKLIGVVASVLFGSSLYALYSSQNNGNQLGGNCCPSEAPCPALIYYKSGGFGGMIKRIDIYYNRTYKLFDKDNLKKEGKLSSQQSKALDYLLVNYMNFKLDYCNDTTGNDLIYRGFRLVDKEVNLGIFDRKCIPVDLYNNVSTIDRMLDDI